MRPLSRGVGLAALAVLGLGCDLPERSLPSQRAVLPPELGAGSAAPAAQLPTPAELAVPPALLSATGLFADASSQQTAGGVEPYEPAYELWSDGALKRRWVFVPPGSAIDTTDMDTWRFPVGTKLWKEFGRDGRALETRYMAKFGPGAGDWVFLAYQWTEDGRDAVAVPNGVPNAGGTTHDIPDAQTCVLCHTSQPNAALGFSAILLAHDRPGVTLDRLIETGRISAPPPIRPQLPGDAVAARALGYLHVNCGSCHNASPSSSLLGLYPDVVFWQSTGQLGSVVETTTYVRMVANTGGDLTRFRSALARMRSRPSRPMPPVATELVDVEGVALVDAWLQQLAIQAQGR